MQPAYTFLYANDGHRCGSDPDCLSRSVGRGWLDHAIDYDGDIDSHIASSDWLFTGQVSQVPVPAALATGLFLLGAFLERWLFFAEARHTVGLYYGSSHA